MGAPDIKQNVNDEGNDKVKVIIGVTCAVIGFIIAMVVLFTVVIPFIGNIFSGNKKSTETTTTKTTSYQEDNKKPTQSSNKPVNSGATTEKQDTYVPTERPTVDYNSNNNNNNNNYHSHSYTSRVTKEATCSSDGVRTYTCSCGDTYTESIYKVSHNWISATCTKPKTCSVCGETSGEPSGHYYYSDGTCGRCGQSNPEREAALKKCSLSVPTLPKSVNYISYNGSINSTCKITNVTYEFDYDNDTGSVELDVYFSGTKTYDYRGSGQSDSCKIGWKLYDPNGNVIETGTFYSPAVAVGESFSNQHEYMLNYKGAAPGKYRLELIDVN